MKLATEVRWMDRRFKVPVEQVQLTERLGFDAVFTAEGTGIDSLTPLAYLAAVTKKIKLGTHVASLTARPPTVLAQAFQTLNAMAGDGRIIVGLGSSLPSYAEGWHGKRFGKPLRRMRDYVNVMQQVFASNGPYDTEGQKIETSELISEEARARLRNPVTTDNAEIGIPYRGEGALGMQPWVSLLETGPVDAPLVLAAIGPKMIELAAEIADGWFPMGFCPGLMEAYKPLLQSGFDKAGGGKSFADFDVWAIVDVLVIDDVKRGLDMFREYVVEYAALMQFGMQVLGYPGLSEKLQELVAAGRRAEALEAVPDDLVDACFVIGPHARIAQRLDPWLSSGATGLIFRYGPQVQVESSGVKEDLSVYETIAKKVHG
jgi:alkanesulfonate monooxygenase SsuD/methylene tetrahydromethanopterin reductase-like flavin-dependent oxidoreductase (luciferase family)